MFSFNNLYEYKDKPFSKMGTFQILPLSENGLQKYFSKDSYNHQFIGKVNKLMLDQLEQENIQRDSKFGISYNNLEQHPDYNATINNTTENENQENICHTTPCIPYETTQK